MRLALILSLALASSAQAQNIGAVAAVVNQARLQHGKAPAHPAALREAVALNDAVETAANSRLQLLLLDRSAFTIGANARLRIDKFVYDPARKSSVYAASVAKGAFRFISGGAGHQAGSTITTRTATIGIRGTILDGAVGELAVQIAKGERAIAADVASDPETATLVVLRGPGAKTTGQVTVGALSVTAAGLTVALDSPLMAAYVPREGAAPIGPFELSLPGLARLNDWILPRLDAVVTPGTAYPTRDNSLRELDPRLGNTPFEPAPAVQNAPNYLPNLPPPPPPPPPQQPCRQTATRGC